MQLSRWFIVTVLSIFRTTSWEWQQRSVFFCKNGPSSASFLFYFVFSKQKLQFSQQIYVKKCYDHPVYGARIQTHDLLNTSLLP